jgi:hypothetical protein
MIVGLQVGKAVCCWGHRARYDLLGPKKKIWRRIRRYRAEIEQE